MLPSIAEVSAVRCQRSFKHFVRESWAIVQPGEVFVDGWHIDAVCEYLQALARDEIKSNNLIINIPPRHMKSLLVNVFFPAWVWTFRPNAKFLFFSYSEDLTVRDSMKCRTLIGSQWYRDRFRVAINPRNDTKAQFDNMHGGYRYSFGMGGSIAGHGGDFLCIDDPLEISKANSDAHRNSVNYTYDNAIFGRKNDPKTAKQVIIMQRLHVDDLVGHVLEKSPSDWEQLILPAEYEGERFQSTLGFVDPRTEAGQLLWPQRFGLTEIESMKGSLSSAGVAGQLQQRPAPLVGNVFKREWFKERLPFTSPVAIYHSWDTAASIQDTAAYSAGIVGYLLPDYRLFIHSIKRDRVEFPQLHYMVEELATSNRALLKGIIIENKSSGIQAIQSLKQTSWTGDYITPFNPKGEKIARAYEAARWAEKGMIVLPTPDPSRPWLQDFEDELFNYPNTKYKDQVDALAQLTDFLSYYLQEGLEARSRR